MALTDPIAGDLLRQRWWWVHCRGFIRGHCCLPRGNPIISHFLTQFQKRFCVKMMLCCLCSNYFDINIFWTNIELPFTPIAAENISKFPKKYKYFIRWSPMCLPRLPAPNFVTRLGRRCFFVIFVHLCIDYTLLFCTLLLYSIRTNDRSHIF